MRCFDSGWTSVNHAVNHGFAGERLTQREAEIIRQLRSGARPLRRAPFDFDSQDCRHDLSGSAHLCPGQSRF